MMLFRIVALLLLELNTIGKTDMRLTVNLTLYIFLSLPRLCCVERFMPVVLRGDFDLSGVEHV